MYLFVNKIIVNICKYQRTRKTIKKEILIYFYTEQQVFKPYDCV